MHCLLPTPIPIPIPPTPPPPPPFPDHALPPAPGRFSLYLLWQFLEVAPSFVCISRSIHQRDVKTIDETEEIE